MKIPNLTLRQRKLLFMLMDQKSCITGKQLAREMGVTDRTIRNDILEINHNIIPFNAEIRAKRSSGYFFVADDVKKIENLIRAEIGLLTKDERVRYLAYRLCLADEKIDLFDLEDEMYTSHTTLDLDLKALQQKYVYSSPYIRMEQKNNSLSFEQDEQKIRTVLTRLTHDDWNYNHRGNAYYGYDFLNENVLNAVMDEVPGILRKYDIYLEDPALVYLNLMITVAFQRYKDGHGLDLKEDVEENDKNIQMAVREIFSILEKRFACFMPVDERHAVYLHILASKLPDISRISVEYVKEYADDTLISLTDAYLSLIKQVFGIDLSADDDFYATLCLTIRNFQIKSYIYNTQSNPDITKDKMLDEFEIAWLFQKLAEEQIGRLLTEYELISLAYCIRGATLVLFRSHPEWKLKTVICTHKNMTVLWYMKQAVLSEFGSYLDVTDLIPVNSKSGFDFGNTDLVLWTDMGEESVLPGVKTISISSFINPQDLAEIAAYIQQRRFERLYPFSQFSYRQMVLNAVWHEKEKRKGKREILNTLIGDFCDDPEMKDKLLRDVVRREEISSFVTGRSIAFFHSLMPAKETRLSIMTMDHRIVWNGYKIRILVMGTFKPEDRALLFYLKHLFYDRDREEMRFLKTKEEICSYFHFD